jgi:hypothetical protein
VRGLSHGEDILQPGADRPETELDAGEEEGKGEGATMMADDLICPRCGRGILMNTMHPCVTTKQDLEETDLVPEEYSETRCGHFSPSPVHMILASGRYHSFCDLHCVTQWIEAVQTEAVREAW